MNTQLLTYIQEECALPAHGIRHALDLFQEGATIPFIARYRKEKTGGLNETQLKQIHTRQHYYATLFERQETILKAIADQGKLTDSLKNTVMTCRDKQTLEDLYAPYKQRRKTKADVAREQGLGPLAEIILSQTPVQNRAQLLHSFVSAAGPITDTTLALEGAKQIVTQAITDHAPYREWLRETLLKTGVIKTKLTSKFKDIKTKFDMYANFSEPLKTAASHRLLAVRRGEAEGVLTWEIVIDSEKALAYLNPLFCKNRLHAFASDLLQCIEASFSKNIYPSVEKNVFLIRCEEAEKDAITVFAKNLEHLLMAPPAGTVVTMGIDPGFRTGCKLAIVDATGQFKETATIYPVPPHQKLAEAEKIFLHLMAKYSVTHIAIGNGTGSKETLQFVRHCVKTHALSAIPVVVNEAGASVYSASDLAVEEYGHLDITVRGAISIAHRLQDPLSELVKIDPKSIGVGQYQHDVNQTELKDALTFTTALGVHAVGVDVNTASAALLTYISGIGPAIAKNIVAHRNENGPFSARKQLLKVAKLGPKAYEQCIGFLRIKNAKNPLDNSAIHPESYGIVERMAQNLGCAVGTLIGNEPKIKQIRLSDYVSKDIGSLTLEDIVAELAKPGVDPRKNFHYATFDDAVDSITDLREGMTLEGVVTNVTNFGAFVDIGVHQDGLIHISKLSATYVKDPHSVIGVGDRVTVTVLQVDVDLKRIQLTRAKTPA